MQILVIRHGQSQADLKTATRTRRLPLTDLGMEQAQLLALLLRELPT